MKHDIVGFLSRPHGLSVLISLLNLKNFNFLKIYTHMLNPKSQDSTRSKRNDYDSFQNICKINGVDLVAIDSKDDEIVDCPECDFIIEVSWRYLIPKHITDKASKGAFGIHRGKLPEYAGAEPIKQALLKNEKEIFLSAHFLDSVIDQGGVLCTTSHPVNYNLDQSFEQNVQRLRDEITPLFSQLVIKTIQILKEKRFCYRS